MICFSRIFFLVELLGKISKGIIRLMKMSLDNFMKAALEGFLKKYSEDYCNCKKNVEESVEYIIKGITCGFSKGIHGKFWKESMKDF